MATRVMVVDANREFAILIRQALEDSQRFSVWTAHSAQEALGLAQEQEFDLCVLDFGLPDSSPQVFLSELRARFPEIVVVAIPIPSAIDEDELQSLNVNAVLEKPFYLPQLASILTDAMNRSPYFSRLSRSVLRKPVMLGEEHRRTPEASEPDLPGWLSDVDATRDALASVLGHGDVESCLLVKDRYPLAYVGNLRRSQARDLAELIASRFNEEPSGSVARYLEPGATGEPRLLFAQTLGDRLILALVLSSPSSLVSARHQAAIVAQALLGKPPEDLEDALQELDTSQVSEASEPLEQAADSQPSAPAMQSQPESQPIPPIPEGFDEPAAPISPDRAPTPARLGLPESRAPERSKMEPDGPAQVEPDSTPPIPPETRAPAEPLAPEVTPSGGPASTEWEPFQPPTAGPLVPQEPYSPPIEEPATDVYSGLPVQPEQPILDESDVSILAEDLPDDWVPRVESDLSANPLIRALIELSEGEVGSLDGQGRDLVDEAVPELPADWLPRRLKGNTLVSVFEGPYAGGDPPPKRPGRLVYHFVLVPRFPAHRLVGPLAQPLVEWVREVCLAWDWGYEATEVDPKYLMVSISLPEDEAPAQAAGILREELSRRLLERFEPLRATLRAGHFWARRHLTASGGRPNTLQVQSFLLRARRTRTLS